MPTDQAFDQSDTEKLDALLVLTRKNNLRLRQLEGFYEDVKARAWALESAARTIPNPEFGVLDALRGALDALRKAAK